ncbi:uncharacterized protein Z518_08299 [Rhinocladiella mackenziei CBS 650.93]|uniref:Rhinocladiella mackenziei CBS 650.93 unplaced genomic scaffold supercont1.6, whole genome shotgun sequence n=1 Tax=Rhinocladiella mackenziei CBS 650.93 TaxID=1442369 RepID=A0A0D2GVQ8_9EURO|nr:uncharacterized protein Z518_08299 [Rhinocladiella mackenziei CBS 650.93]KIX02358.1 hypothetical protein Z518_08299 [Rhinocladiella mackenziei CBS 650.93]
MSAPNQGRQSPDPERQTGAQQQAHPSQPGTGKMDNSQAKNKGKEDQTANLESNPVHILAASAEEKTSKSRKDV